MAQAKTNNHNACNNDVDDIGGDDADGNNVDNVFPANRCHHQRVRGQRRHASPFDVDNDDETDLDGVGATGDIIPPPLARRDEFNITSTMIQLLNLKGLFRGIVRENQICT